MELIIGGAFQGKTAFAKENFGITDKALAVGDLFHAGYLEALSLLDDLHEAARVRQTVRCAGVQPGDAAAHGHHAHTAFL